MLVKGLRDALGLAFIVTMAAVLLWMTPVSPWWLGSGIVLVGLGTAHWAWTRRS